MRFALIFFILLSACRRAPDRLVTVTFDRAPGLAAGQRVFFRGIEVGGVQRIVLTDSGVTVTLRVERADAPIRSEDGVRVSTVGVVGERAIEIIPGPRGATLVQRQSVLEPVVDSLAEARDALARALADRVAAEFVGRDSTGALELRMPTGGSTPMSRDTASSRDRRAKRAQ